MTTRMLIDARHREETRVAVVKGNRIEEFDFESAERKQLKGNIYLAKVTRVEPSLQAAFIDYGGNRHGFLAFSEIHPDYYQIPKEDREALLREEAEHAAQEAALRAEQDAEEDQDVDEPSGDRVDDDAGTDEEAAADPDGAAPRKRRGSGGSDDQVEDLRQRRMNLRRRYKIQDVIRRRQVLLVQVVKEERGNKGAALTTYLSLAGRYCVLMPNTSHGGGISRKISNAADRKRLKTIMAELKLPSTMGCIVRTAGLQRTKAEIKRDFDYLARLWDGIREKTLASAAPALIHGDSDLIKRAVRDIYNKDIDEVIVEGDDGYRHAKEFMKLLMPSHARRVTRYADAVPLFQRFNVEDQLAAMYHPVVQLKSGGYLVINPTEALVSIDINSGRSTREHNIEGTATATNLEAAQEIARQLRLRDMAGLVVIDFIDMDNGSNVRKVEKAMKEALKNDRARIQVGRISSFGLMEMSRQRLRTGVLEASTRQCPHCEGTGLVRTASSAGLSALRLIEDEAARGRGSLLTLRASQEAALYVLNRKRADIAEIEARYGVSVEVLSDGEQEGARMSVDASGPPPAFTPTFEPIIEDEEPDVIEDVEEEEDEVEEIAAEPRRPDRERAETRDGDGEGADGRRRRRRRRGRRGRPREDEAAPRSDGETEATSDEAEESDVEAMGDAEQRAETAGGAEGRRRRGRRGRRGGRRETGEQVVGSYAVDGDAPVETLTGEEADAFAVAPEQPVEEADAGDAGPIVTLPPADAIASGEDAPRKGRRRPRAKLADEAAPAEPMAADALAVDAAPKPRRSRRKADADAPTADIEAPAADAKPKRTRRKATPTPDADADRSAAADPIGVLAAANDATAPVLDGVAVADGAGDLDGAGPLDDAAGPSAAETASPATDAPGPVESGSTRRGWWQRTFGA